MGIFTLTSLCHLSDIQDIPYVKEENLWAFFERLFDLNHDGTLNTLEKGLEFTVIEDIMNDDEDNDDLFSSDLDDEFDTDFGDDF